jgi:hypothetical protein
MNRRSAGFGLGCLVIVAALAVTACGPGATFPVPNVTSAATLSSIGVDVTPTPGSTPTDAVAPTPTVPAPTPTPAPAVPSITITKITESGNAAGCGNWTISFEKPVVSGVPTAATMNAAIAAKVNAFINDFKAQLSSGGPGPCDLTGRASVTLNSDGLIGISFNESSYTGGAHPATIAGSINLIVSSGATVSMGQLFIGTSAPAVLSTQSRLLLTALLGPDGVDASFIDPGTTPLMSSFDTAWAFRKEGLEVTFQQYEVAPGVEGTPTIVIPWASLKSVIDPSGPAGPLVK